MIKKLDPNKRYNFENGGLTKKINEIIQVINELTDQNDDDDWDEVGEKEKEVCLRSSLNCIHTPAAATIPCTCDGETEHQREKDCPTTLTMTGEERNTLWAMIDKYDLGDHDNPHVRMLVKKLEAGRNE